ncbi:hypothetical protein EDC96DRAFT_519801 [Choanephora cucurbitarum]|nr:hypothetical protein EDC96DRAFT_519801 [Choanephora cucurbitarum]
MLQTTKILLSAYSCFSHRVQWMIAKCCYCSLCIRLCTLLIKNPLNLLSTKSEKVLFHFFLIYTDIAAGSRVLYSFFLRILLSTKKNVTKREDKNKTT